MITHPTQTFNEAEWLRLLFLLSDTHVWLQDMEHSLLYQLPLPGKSKLYRNTYYLPVTSLAHLLEKHYFKISRHPGCGKFTIPVAEIVHWIKECFHIEQMPVAGSLNFQRFMDTRNKIGYTRDGDDTSIITVITTPGGEIKTAFPGNLSY